MISLAAYTRGINWKMQISTINVRYHYYVLFSSSAAVFTVMCYNVLCDKYATRQLYGYCPSWALNWEYRKKGIMEEITNCDADIISLQVNRDGRRSLNLYQTLPLCFPCCMFDFKFQFYVQRKGIKADCSQIKKNVRSKTAYISQKTQMSP